MEAGTMYSIRETLDTDESGSRPGTESLPGSMPSSQIIRPEEPLEAEIDVSFSFARDRGSSTSVNDLKLLVEQVAAEQLSRLERRVRTLEAGSSTNGITLDSPGRPSQAVQLRELELRLSKLTKDLHAASESHRNQILKVTQAVGELGRELTSRVENIENSEAKIFNGHDNVIEEEYRSCTAELFAIVKQHGASLSKQELALSSLREDLRSEQRIRKDEIHLKLRELAARPVRPEEQSINDLRQSVMSVRDECSKLRAECRRLSSEVMAHDSDALSRVLRQLSDMRNLLDHSALDETVQLPVGLGKVNMEPAKRLGGDVGKPGRISPGRDRALKVRSTSLTGKDLSAKKPGRGSLGGNKPAAGDASKGEDHKTSPQRRSDDISQVANMGTTPLTLDTSRSSIGNKSRSKSLEGLRSEEVAQATPSDAANDPSIMRPTQDTRLQAAVAAVIQGPKAAMPQAISEIASARAGSPGPVLYTRGCVVTRPTSPPIGRHPSQAPAYSAVPPRIGPMPGNCHVIAVGYQHPGNRPMLRPGPVPL